MSNILLVPHCSMSLTPRCPCCTFSSIGNCPGTTGHHCRSCNHPHSCHKHYSVVVGLTAGFPNCFDNAFSFPPGSGDHHRTCVYLEIQIKRFYFVQLTFLLIMLYLLFCFKVPGLVNLNIENEHIKSFNNSIKVSFDLRKRITVCLHISEVVKYFVLMLNSKNLHRPFSVDYLVLVVKLK